MLMSPVPGSMVRVPWASVPTAQYIATVHDLDGAPHYADPRNALEITSERFELELGMKPVVPVELEFFLMDRALGAGRQPDCAPVARSTRHGRSATRPIIFRIRGICAPSSRTSMPCARSRAYRPRR